MLSETLMQSFTLWYVNPTVLLFCMEGMSAASFSAPGHIQS